MYYLFFVIKGHFYSGWLPQAAPYISDCVKKGALHSLLCYPNKTSCSVAEDNTMNNLPRLTCITLSAEQSSNPLLQLFVHLFLSPFYFYKNIPPCANGTI